MQEVKCPRCGKTAGLVYLYPPDTIHYRDGGEEVIEDIEVRCQECLYSRDLKRIKEVA